MCIFFCFIENDRQRQELNKMVEAEKQKKRRQWDEERKTRENNDMKNKLDEDRRNREDEVCNRHS